MNFVLSLCLCSHVILALFVFVFHLREIYSDCAVFALAMCLDQVQISKVCAYKDTATLRKTQGTPWDIVDTMGGGGGRVSHVFSHSAFTLMSVPLPTGPVAE